MTGTRTQIELHKYYKILNELTYHFTIIELVQGIQKKEED